MGALVYSMITSLDGYVVDATGRFDWAEPDEEVHGFVNDAFAGVGTYLYGRRMYETMVFWETAGDGSEEPEEMRSWARQWRAADKVVFSATLTEPRSARTQVLPAFDPGVVAELKASTEHDLSIDGPTLAAHALRAGLVDEIQPILSPVIVGGGTRFLPDDLRLDLGLVEERRFGNGVVSLRYRVRSPGR